MQCFARDWSEFRSQGCEILGISADPIAKHQDFARKLRLEFPLLSDASRTVARLYDVDSFLGTRRAYFIVDRQGLLRYKHVEFLPISKRDDAELLSVLRSLK
jgi:peroxiredoxin